MHQFSEKNTHKINMLQIDHLWEQDMEQLLSIQTWLFPTPDSKVHGANMGPTWVLSAPDGPHIGAMNLAIRDKCHLSCFVQYSVTFGPCGKETKECLKKQPSAHKSRNH